MHAKTVKIAISLPKDVMDQIEEIRHKLDWPRSRAILEAVSLWLKKKEEEQLVRKHREGYKKHPENRAELDAFFKAGLSSFTGDSWE